MFSSRPKCEVRKLSIVFSRTHADVFLERYDWLMDWARRFAEDQQQARDIVHDAFIQFTLKAPDLSAIRSLDNYLCTMVRNLHVSQLRRRIASPIRSLSVLDHDSAEWGLSSADQSARLQLRDQLKLICRWACYRKETSKLGSVLILRFFHGHYHGEIARIMNCSRQAVDDRLLAARREARAYLAEPEELPPLKADPFSSTRDDSDEEAFLRGLRSMIFSSRSGECLGEEEFRSRYARLNGTPLSCETVAHVVSCRACLDAVSDILGLPRVADRHPADALHGRTK